MSNVRMYMSFILLLNHVHSLIASNAATSCSDSSVSYKRTECLAINCGSAGNGNSSQQPDQRNWIRDDDATSNLIMTITHHRGEVTQSSNSHPPPPPNHALPYSSARLSRREFSYLFPVTSGPKFLRLHFYPASYSGGFDKPSGFFSVFANGYTLLSNFSPSLSLKTYSTFPFMSREFCIWIAAEDINLTAINITFAPSPSPTTPNAYAFINGIEIVSMPPHLYYSPEDDHGAACPGNRFLRVENNTALEMMFRLNVGGPPIEAQRDTGMYRDWPSDVTYTPETELKIKNPGHKIEFAETPSYVAPLSLYETARTMGQSGSGNRNLTWTLTVDVGFNYLFRLHFCEIELMYSQENDRIFQISIADQIVEDLADVLMWTKKKEVPVYKDYAVFVTKEGSSASNRRNVNVSLLPNLILSRYSDAILNGLEVFKISSFKKHSLAAPNPIPPWNTPPQIRPSPCGQNHKNSIFSLATAISGGGVVLAFFSLLCLYLVGRSKRTFRAGTGLPSGLCRHFTLSEIKAATNNFAAALVVGRGGFGDVYKGAIDSGATAVAIKRLKQESKQGSHEFKTEIEMLSRLRHLHLVSLIGYCNDQGEMILVYAYVSRGTLRCHLYSSSHNTLSPNPPLSWKQRLTICLGAARGLHYLHGGAKDTIIHRDVKTTNILLDDKWVAKVSDFGLSKLGPVGMDDPVSTQVKGSFGYLDPEYFRRQKLTEKSDVYSFGVVLLEVLCGRPPVNQSLPRNEVSLAVWARIHSEEGTLYQIMDPQLDGQITSDCLIKYAEIAMSCLQDEGAKRPAMEDVVGGLELVLQVQEEADEGTQNVDYYSAGPADDEP